jgi:hypothetical protein
LNSVFGFDADRDVSASVVHLDPDSTRSNRSAMIPFRGSYRASCCFTELLPDDGDVDERLSTPPREIIEKTAPLRARNRDRERDAIGKPGFGIWKA